MQVSRDTAQGVETCVLVSLDFDPYGTDGKGRTCGSHGVSMGGRAHSSRSMFNGADQGVQRVYNISTRKLGYVRDRQQTMILQVSFRKREKE